MIEPYLPEPYLPVLSRLALAPEDDPASESFVLNKTPIDWWTPMHFGSGLVVGLLGVPFWAAVAITVGYEVLEYYHETPSGSLLFGSQSVETPLNSTIDVAAYLAGWSLGTRVR